MQRSAVASFFVILGLGLSFFASNVAAQGVPTVGTIQIVSMNGADTNGNGLFDELRVSFIMNVTVGGNFDIRTGLMTWGGYSNYSFYANETTMNLSAGSHALTTSVLGAAIYRSGIDGPYTVQILPVAVPDSGDFVYPPFPPYGGVTAVTGPMNHTDFDPSWAQVNGPLSDEGQDTNGNGLYEYLVVHVPLSVSARRPFSVYGLLRSSTGVVMVPSLDEESRVLRPGQAVWAVRFDGRYLGFALRFSPAPGPFSVTVTVSLDGLGQGNTTTYTTRTYAQSEFELTPASLEGQSFNGTPEDTNGDGLADFLDFHVPVTVRTEGDYLGILDLLGSSGPGATSMPPVAERLMHLTTGAHTLDFRISGVAIGRLLPASTLMGIVYLAQLVDVSPASPSYGGFPSDVVQWAMPFPSATFDARPAQTLTLAVTGIRTPSCVQVVAVDPTTRVVASRYSISMIGNAATVSLNLYDGTFSIVVSSCSPPLAATALTVAVSGPTTADVALPDPRPVVLRAAVVPTNWNRTNVALSADLGAQSLRLRFLADIMGNFDGTTDAAELWLAAKNHLFGPIEGTLGSYEFPIPDLHMGGRPLDLASTTFLAARGAGSIVSSGPVTVQASLAYASANDLGPAPRTLSVRVPYADENATFQVRVDASAFDVGDVRGRSIMEWGDGGFTWDTNAAIRSVGSNVWDVSVGPKPAYLGADVVFDFQVDLTGGPHLGSLDMVFMLALIVAPAVIVLVAFLLARRRPRSGGQRGPK